MVGRVVLGLAQTFFLMGPLLVYLGAGVADAHGTAHYTAGTLVAITALQIRLYQPVRDLLEMSMQLIASQAMFDRIFEYLDLPHEIVDSPNARTLAKSDVTGAISFRDVWFRYAAAAGDGHDSWTLRGVSLDVRPGQLVALVGPSGAGKTTISYLLARLYDVDRGSVRIDGVDVRDIRMASLTELIGVVTQETQLFHATIGENLLYARPGATQKELEDAARLAFIHDRIVALADGYGTVVGERGYRLSAGEKQRLAIARVILKDPRILILDEATSALDTVSERLVQRALHSITVERTTVAIAHRLSTILAADVIFVVDGGQIVERGTHGELVARSGLYSQLYRRQFSAELVEIAPDAP
jgi:ATP-binding cassette subfamily B protein